jgi:hypothetical protein
MPYKTKKVGKKNCVYKKDSGKKVGCTGGSKEAKRKYLAALAINAESVQNSSFDATILSVLKRF